MACERQSGIKSVQESEVESGLSDIEGGTWMIAHHIERAEIHFAKVSAITISLPREKPIVGMMEGEWEFITVEDNIATCLERKITDEEFNATMKALMKQHKILKSLLKEQEN